MDKRYIKSSKALRNKWRDPTYRKKMRDVHYKKIKLDPVIAKLFPEG